MKPRNTKALLTGFIFALQLVCGLANAAQACCGVVTEKGKELALKLDSSGVDQLWLAGHHINWETGMPDMGDKPAHTHCSAFVAAFAKKEDVYILRPPQHSQVFLASAQVDWLASDDAGKNGWHKADDMRFAQEQANKGRLVVVAFPSADPKKPGHIAIVRPSEISDDELRMSGPHITQAGQMNFVSSTVKEGFRHHRGAWPDGVVYYFHD